MHNPVGKTMTNDTIIGAKGIYAQWKICRSNLKLI